MSPIVIWNAVLNSLYTEIKIQIQSSFYVTALSHVGDVYHKTAFIINLY